MKPAQPVTSALVKGSLRDPSVVEFDYLVGGAREPRRMGDEDACASAHEAIQAFHHLVLAVPVERRRGLVQDDDRWVAQQRAGDPDALALAARETHALRSELGVVAVGETADEVV